MSRGQFLRFSSRIGRRLLKNQIFLDKLADCLDGASASDASEKDEEPWGLDDGEADLDGYDQQEYSEDMLESTESDEGHEGANNRSKLSYPSGQQSRLQEADGSDSQEDSYGVSGEEDESSIQQSDPEAGADSEDPKIVITKRKEVTSSQDRNNSSRAGAASVSPQSPRQSPRSGHKSPDQSNNKQQKRDRGKKATKRVEFEEPARLGDEPHHQGVEAAEQAVDGREDVQASSRNSLASKKKDEEPSSTSNRRIQQASGHTEKKQASQKTQRGQKKAQHEGAPRKTSSPAASSPERQEAGVDRSSKPGSKQKSRRKATAPASTRLPKQVDATQDRELTVAQAERVHEASSASLSIAEEEDDIPASAPARPASKPESQSKEK